MNKEGMSIAMQVMGVMVIIIVVMFGLFVYGVWRGSHDTYVECQDYTNCYDDGMEMRLDLLDTECSCLGWRCFNRTTGIEYVIHYRRGCYVEHNRTFESN